jgi:protein-disulfide isomerase
MSRKKTRPKTKPAFINKTIIGAVCALLIVLLGSFIVISKYSSSKSAPDLNGGLGAPPLIIGNPNAKVTLVEFGDFQCPQCKRFFQQTEPQIRAAYINKGLVKLEYHVFPWIGPDSVRAGEAAYCANDQNAFTAYHDELYQAQGAENTGVFSAEELRQLAEKIDLNMGTFNACYSSGKYQALVESGIAQAQANNVNGTPTIIIGDHRVIGAQSFVIYKTLIDEQL